MNSALWCILLAKAPRNQPTCIVYQLITSFMPFFGHKFVMLVCFIVELGPSNYYLFLVTGWLGVPKLTKFFRTNIEAYLNPNCLLIQVIIILHRQLPWINLNSIDIILINNAFVLKCLTFTQYISYFTLHWRILACNMFTTNIKSFLNLNCLFNQVKIDATFILNCLNQILLCTEWCKPARFSKEQEEFF